MINEVKMSFSYHKKFYSQQTNKSSERCESLEDINFAFFANIQQIEMYKKFPMIWSYVPFLTTYFIVDTLIYQISDKYVYLYFPLTILAVIDYIILNRQKLKYKKFCLGFSTTYVHSTIEKFVKYYNYINLAIIILLLPAHIVILISSNVSILFDVLLAIILLLCWLGNMRSRIKL